MNIMDKILEFNRYACGCIYDSGIKECVCPKHGKGLVEVFEERIPEQVYTAEEHKPGFNFYFPEDIGIEHDRSNRTVRFKWDNNCLVVHEWDFMYPREQIVFKSSIEGHNYYFPDMVKVRRNHENDSLVLEWISENGDTNRLMVKEKNNDSNSNKKS